MVFLCRSRAFSFCLRSSVLPFLKGVIPGRFLLLRVYSAFCPSNVLSSMVSFWDARLRKCGWCLSSISLRFFEEEGILFDGLRSPLRGRPCPLDVHCEGVFAVVFTRSVDLPVCDAAVDPLILRTPRWSFEFGSRVGEAGVAACVRWWW